MEDRFEDGPPRVDRLTLIVDRSLGIVFVLLAVWFVLGSTMPHIPSAASAPVSRELIAPGAPRSALGDPPMTKIGGYLHNCNDCHRLFQSDPAREQDLYQHASIVLDHGLNNRCTNCHAIDDRERLILLSGETVPFSQTPRLCSGCHGTVYRDWERGMHGKTLGSWSAASGNQRRLNCNECHDPHAPAYESFVPLPPPNTLRMGNQHEEVEHGGRHIPLQRWQSESHAPAPGGGAAEHDEEHGEHGEPTP
jgi:hypothetical protein